MKADRGQPTATGDALFAAPTVDAPRCVASYQEQATAAMTSQFQGFMPIMTLTAPASGPGGLAGLAPLNVLTTGAGVSVGHQQVAPDTTPQVRAAASLPVRSMCYSALMPWKLPCGSGNVVVGIAPHFACCSILPPKNPSARLRPHLQHRILIPPHTNISVPPLIIPPSPLPQGSADAAVDTPTHSQQRRNQKGSRPPRQAAQQQPKPDASGGDGGRPARRSRRQTRGSTTADDCDTDEHTDSPAASGGGSGGLAKMRSNAFDTESMLSVDPRRAKRILANRQSAQRSRMKRLQHVHDLELQTAELHDQIQQLQEQVMMESRRANEAAAAAEAANAAVTVLRQRVQQQEGMQSSLRAQLNALRSQAAAAGLPVLKETALSLPSLPPLPPSLPPSSSSATNQQQQQQPQRPQSWGLMFGASRPVAPGLPDLAGSAAVPAAPQPPQQQPQQGPTRAASLHPLALPASPLPGAAAAAGTGVLASPVDMDRDFVAAMLDDVHGVAIFHSSLEDGDGDLFGGGFEGLTSPDGERRRMSL